MNAADHSENCIFSAQDSDWGDECWTEEYGTLRTQKVDLSTLASVLPEDITDVVNLQDSNQNQRRDIDAHDLKSHERKDVRAHVSTQEESHGVSAKSSKRKRTYIQADDINPQAKDPNTDLPLKQRKVMQLQSQQPKMVYQQKQSEHQPLFEQEVGPLQQKAPQGRQQLQPNLTVEYTDQELSLQISSQSFSQFFQQRQRQAGRDPNNDHQEEQRLNPFPWHQGNRGSRQQVQNWQDTKQIYLGFRLVLRAYEYRMRQAFAVMEECESMTQPEQLDSLKLLLNLAIAFLVLARYERTYGPTPEMHQMIPALFSPDSTTFENTQMNYVLTILAETEHKLEARKRAQEQYLDSDAPIIQQQIGQQFDRLQHQHSHISPPQPPPQTAGSQEARLREPESRHAGWLRHHHSTIEDLLAQHAHTRDDLSEQLVCLHLALAQLHLCERDCHSLPDLSLEDVLFIQYVEDMIDQVMKKIYQYEDQISAEALLECNVSDYISSSSSSDSESSASSSSNEM